MSFADRSTGSLAAGSLLCLHSRLVISPGSVALNTKHHPCDYNAQWWGLPLLVQWLRLWAPSIGGLSLIPGQGTRSPKPQLRVCMPQLRSKIPHATAKTQWIQINIINIKNKTTKTKNTSQGCGCITLRLGLLTPIMCSSLPWHPHLMSNRQLSLTCPKVKSWPSP